MISSRSIVAVGAALALFSLFAVARTPSGDPGDVRIAADDETAPPGARRQSASLYEIRSYHFAPDRLADYRSWAESHAVEYLRRELDVVGFWVSDEFPAELRGAPVDSLGSANVTWIIRWGSKAERDVRIEEVFSTPEWREIFSRLPGGASGYLRIESRFAEGL